MGCAGSKPAEPSVGVNANVPAVCSRRPTESTEDKTNSELALEMKEKETNLLECLEVCEVNEENAEKVIQLCHELMERHDKLAGKHVDIDSRLLHIFAQFTGSRKTANSVVNDVIDQSAVDQTTRQWLLSEFTENNALSARNDQMRRSSSFHTMPDMSLFFDTNFDVAPTSQWNFNVFDHDIPVLITYVVKMFEHFDLLKRFNITAMKLSCFFTEISTLYNKENPYHNFYHGADVLHHIFVFLNKTSIIRTCRLRSLDLYGLMIAAVCHDVGHPGTNNVFQVNSNSELARLYNDTGVLEHHHAATTFLVLNNPTCNICNTLSKDDYREVRKLIIETILTTEMIHHFDCVAKGKRLFAKIEEACSKDLDIIDENSSAPTHKKNTKSDSSSSNMSEQFDRAKRRVSIVQTSAPPLTREETRQVLSIALHAADISNTLKPWDLSKDWADRINEEFLAQGDAEKRLELPISPFMDRETMNQDQMSLNFIDFIVAPLHQIFLNTFPEIRQCALHLLDNRHTWESRLLDNIKLKHAGDAKLEQEEIEKVRTRSKLFNDTFKLPAEAVNSTHPITEAEVEIDLEMEREIAAEREKAQ